VNGGGEKTTKKAKKDLETLRTEIKQKEKEIEQLKEKVDKMGTQIQEKEKLEKTGEPELGKMIENVSGLLDVGFGIFGRSEKSQGGKSKGQGLIGLIDNLAKLSEKSQTYQKRVELGKTGEVNFRVTSRPIRGSAADMPDRIKISRPQNKISPAPTKIPSASIKEREPMVDVFEDGDFVNVTAELPGVEESKVKLEVAKDVITIRSDTSARKYYKEVKLPTSVKKNPAESRFRNGILEIKLVKAKHSGKKDA
jgi:HSP20 family molecular chaperone IbpA